MSGGFQDGPVVGLVFQAVVLEQKCQQVECVPVGVCRSDFLVGLDHSS